MEQFRTVLVVVVVGGLVRNQASVVGNSNATETTTQECGLLSNLTVTPDFDTFNNYINLKLSWNEIDNNNNTVSISIIQQPDSKYNCLAEMHIFDHSLLNNSILQSDMVTSQGEVNPGCSYTIYIFSEYEKGEQINCQFNYTLPDCVESKCDCDKYKPNPKILDLEHISGNKFKIKWDPGDTTTGGDFYEIREMRFSYKGEFDLYRESAEIIESDLEKHVSEIQMKLFKGENYTLIGNFRNNFSCRAESTRSFTAPMESQFSVSVIIFALIGVILILVVILKFQNMVKYKTKVLNVIIPGRRRNHQDLVALRSEQLPMTTKFQYIPAEISEGVVDEYEFPSDWIIIKEVIGSGAFGQVYSAKAIGIGSIDGFKMVAVKTLGEGENITREAINDFIAEIEIFKTIGKHPNIVALLGCCTVDTPYMMIMEFVPCGDLKKYLLELRAQWLKRKNISMSRQIFFPDGSYIDPPSPTSSNSTKTGRLPSVSENACSSPDVPMTPLLAHYANALNKILDDTELQNFALQIAKGMSHLEKIGVTHRSLAARNILINEYKILKISGFGLSRSGPYINHKTKKLPLRWMAIEAIVEQKYDSKSDVWSFGVVLWEIGTLGAFPYESVPDSFLQQFLQMGRRLERPEICTNELYELMRLCWARNPEDRPTFRELVEALDVKKRRVYVNFNHLNPTYVFPPSDFENFAQIGDIHMQ
ncbi:receptor-like tyrosine-protein kinase kin-16 isoform X2 [Zophobas morio]|uniref:receptor-like tyrosine-protein kinase kin-16 isoform X2 n=1 Tax=Zophobas morio TaxID=2755281 RepID=UPI0030826D4A